MKSKIKRGKDFSGLCRYILRKSANPDLIGGNLAGVTASELAIEFQQVASLRADIERPVWHSSLALPKGDKLTDQQWNEIVKDYMEGLGFDLKTTPFVVVRHQNTGSDHVHIAASRVSLSRKLYLGKNENLIASRLCQRLEQAHGLTITPGPDHKADKKALKTTEKAQQQRTNKVPPRKLLQDSIDKIINNNSNLTVDKFISELGKKGITARQNVSKNGKMSGFSFEVSGIAFKASQLGKQYGWQTLEKRLAATIEKPPAPAKQFKPVAPAPPAAEPEVAAPAAAGLLKSLGDEDLNKIGGLVASLLEGGIGLPPLPSSLAEKVSDSKELPRISKPLPPPLPPIRDKADRAEFRENTKQIRRLSSELWASRRGKKQPGLLGKIIRWQRESVLFNNRIKELKKRNAEIRAKAEAALMAPTPAPEPQPRLIEVIRGDLDRIEQQFAVTASDRQAHRAAYLKPITDEVRQLKPQIDGYKADFKAWQQQGEERGWKPGHPPLTFGRADFKAWEQQGQNLAGRAEHLKQAQTALSQRLEAAERNYTHAPQWSRRGGEECDLAKLPAQKAETQSPEYRALKTEMQQALRKEVESKPEVLDFINKNKKEKTKKQKKERGSQGLSL